VGVPALQVGIYPGAFLVHSDAQLAKNIEAAVFPQIVARLTEPVRAAEAVKTADPRDIVFTGNVDETTRFFTDKGWTEGLAVIPPTVEKVEEFLKYTDLPANEEIAVLSPSGLIATPWNIAVNGVMAGCRPEYMPILIAIVEAIGDPTYPMEILGSTSGVNPFIWINGPVGRQLRIHHGQGLTAWPTNQVIGRALGLIWMNIGGFRLEESRMGSFGYTLPWVLAENEELLAKVGWKAFHEERGFDRNVSTVAPNQSNQWGSQLHPAGTDAKAIMESLAWEISNKAPYFKSVGGYRVCMITPPVAEVLAAGGYTKESLKKDLLKNARITAHEAAYTTAYGFPPGTPPPFDVALKRTKSGRNAEKGMLPPWFEKIPGWEEIVTIPAASGIEILICGDEGRNKAQTLSGIGARLPTPKQIKLPANWDRMMEELGYKPLKSYYL
jgi:hypothetical protein